MQRVREMTQSDRNWAAELVRDHFASPLMVSRGVCHDTRVLPGLVIEEDGRRLGLLHYHIAGCKCEIVVLVVLRRRQGFGERLLQTLVPVARARSCRCLWLVTTNDNLGAQLFYGALGWRKIAVHRGAVAESRRLKPEIPECAADGTPITDEIEYELALEGGEAME